MNNLLEICESLNWSVTEDDDYIELEKYSPAGEDFLFSVRKDSFADDVEEYAKGFDIDEHVTMWLEAKRNGMRGVPSARELVYDAEAIDKMLQELVEALLKFRENGIL